MTSAVHISTRVLPGKKIEITAPDLVEGDIVDVYVLPTQGQSGSANRSALEFLDSLPEGPRLFDTWGAYESHLQSERNSWEHH